MDEENEEEFVGNITRQPQPLLFPSVRNYGTNQEQNTKGAPLEWLTNTSYDGRNAVDALDSKSVIDKKVREDHLAWNKDLSIHSDEGEKTIHRNLESASSCDSEVGTLRHQKKKKKRKKQKAHKHKHKYKHEEKHESRKSCSTSKIPEELMSKPDTLWIDDVNFPPDEAFRVSRKPDLDNCMYDTLYRLDVALYKLKPSLTCLGLSRHQAIQLSEQKSKSKRKIQEVLRYWHKEGLNCEPKTISIITERNCNNLNVSNYSYVPLELPEKAPDAVNTQSNDISEGKNIDSSPENSISQRTAEFNKKLHTNPHDVETWIAFVKFQEEAVLQGEALKMHFSDAKNEQRKKASASVIEKKISIYEKALEHNPNSIELITGHLHLCSEVWSPEKLLERWKKIVFIHPNKTALWRQYIHFAQSHFSLFYFGKVVNVYQKCIETLSSIKEGEFTSHKSEGDIESDLLDLFVQQCHFMRQSGHTEKAFSCFQALIEMSCFCPKDLEKSTPLKEKVQFLETFWDCGVPRFGEDGAGGWKNWMNSSVFNERASSTFAADLTQLFKATGKSVDNKTEDDDESLVMLQENLAQWQAWLKVETSRENHHWKPWQPDKEAGETEEDCEDPERLVLFDDVSSSLFNIGCLENKFQLVVQFLIFLGVPLPLTNCTASSESILYLNTCLEDKQQILKMYQGQRLGLWRTCKWTGSLLGNDNAAKSGTHVLPPKHLIDFVRNAFAQSLCIFEGNPKSFLMTLWICYEIKLWQQETEPKVKKAVLKDVRKLAKSFLKMPSNRNDLLVWQTYAELEWLAGNVTEARRILDSTLAMSWDIVSQNGAAQSTVTSLFRTYAELEVGLILQESSANQSQLQSGANRALHILTAFAEGEQFQPIGVGEVTAVSPIRILKTQKQFEQLISHVAQDFHQSEDDSTLPVQGSGQGIGIGSLLVHLVACHGLFQYLTSGLKEMCQAFDHVLSAVLNDKLSPGSTKALDIELIWTAYIRLLKYHSERHPMPLKDARKILLAALNWFPENPEFLSFYVGLEAKSNVSGNIRRFFDRAVQTAASPIPWIFSVFYEQSRSATVQSVMQCSLEVVSVQDGAQRDSLHPYSTTLPTTGITHRQRSLLDKSSTNLTTQGCVALWRMYIQFEMQYGSQERAKAVFYQALQHCPWAKVLYLDAVRYFPGELQSIVDLMEEKEIRVRIPLEELQLLME